MDDTRGCHVRFRFLERSYIYDLNAAVEANDNAHITHHKVCALRSHLLYLVDMSIFVDKNAYYVNVVYLRYFIDLGRIHEYN